jgi:low affinity Fe/Cu permease
MRQSVTYVDVATLEKRIDELQRERQELRHERGGSAALEHNRLELVRAQRELSLALIERHLHPASAL